MNINLLAIGKRMPDWVNAGTTEYLRRMPRDYTVNLIEISSVTYDKKKESAALFEKCNPEKPIIALDRLGKTLDTRQLSVILREYHDSSQDIQLLIGGPDGIHEDYLKKADQLWSLSALTLPHPLVRILLCEQLYRAWTLLTGHPYHK